MGGGLGRQEHGAHDFKEESHSTVSSLSAGRLQGWPVRTAVGGEGGLGGTLKRGDGRRPGGPSISADVGILSCHLKPEVLGRVPHRPWTLDPGVPAQEGGVGALLSKPGSSSGWKLPPWYK